VKINVNEKRSTEATKATLNQAAITGHTFWQELLHVNKAAHSKSC
jgi:hypothetical protein